MWQFWCREEYIDTGKMSTGVYIYMCPFRFMCIASKANRYFYLMLSGSYFLSHYTYGENTFWFNI